MSLTTTTLPVGLVRDLEAACARPGAGVVTISFATPGTPPSVVDRRFGPAKTAPVPLPCPGCSAPMTIALTDGRRRLRCPECDLGVSPREYWRMTRVALGVIAGG